MGDAGFWSGWFGRWEPNLPRPPLRDTLRGRSAPALRWRLESLTAPGWRRRALLQLMVPITLSDLLLTGAFLGASVPGRFWWPPVVGAWLGSCLGAPIVYWLLSRWGRPRAVRTLKRRLALLDPGASAPAPARPARQRKVAACGAAIVVVTSVGVLAAVSFNVRRSHDRESKVGQELMTQLTRAHLEPGAPVSTSVRADTELPNGIMGDHRGCGVSAVADISGHSYDDLINRVPKDFPSESLVIQLPEHDGRVRIIAEQQLDTGWLRFFDLRCLRPPAH